MGDFWQELPRPFLVLAPMEDVTDVVFREIIADLPRPDVFFTEFVSADGLASKGRDITLRKFKYTESQRPIVAQIWGIDPVNLKKAARLAAELKFDGIDINMGCPDRAVMKKGAGAALCLTQKLAKEIIMAVKDGAKDLPVSVKTRLGYDKVVTDEWISFLLSQNLAALTIHGRTALQMSKGEANWEEIGKAVKLKQKIAPETIIIGNGDIKSFKEALKMHELFGVDGVMIARGVFANPWVFSKSQNQTEHQKDEYIEILRKHLNLYEETWGDSKNFEVMKKFFKMYVKSFKGANQLRQRLMECKSKAQVIELLSN